MATEDALNQVAQARRMTDELIRRIRGTDAAPSFANLDVQNSGSLRQLEVDYALFALLWILLKTMGFMLKSRSLLTCQYLIMWKYC